MKKSKVMVFILCIIFLFPDVSLLAAGNRYLKVESGPEHVLALSEDGTVLSWGRNSYGCLGDGTEMSRYAPKKVIGINGIVDIAAGDAFSVALKSDGTVWGWGLNYSNQLGLDPNKVYKQFVPVQLPNLKDIVRIEAGDNAFYCFDNNGNYYIGTEKTTSAYDVSSLMKVDQVGTLKNFKTFKARRSLALGIKNDGTVWKWEVGDDNFYEGTYFYERCRPTEVKEFNGARDVAVGMGCLYIIDANGRLFSYGENNWGQLGNGFTSFTTVPYKINGIDNVKDISVLKNIYAIHNNGTVSIVSNQKYEEKFKKAPITDVVKIVQTIEDVFALKSDGTVWTWQTGLRLGKNLDNYTETPRHVQELKEIVDIFANQSYVTAINGEGAIYVYDTYRYEPAILDIQGNPSKFGKVANLDNASLAPYYDFNNVILLSKDNKMINRQGYGNMIMSDFYQLDIKPTSPIKKFVGTLALQWQIYVLYEDGTVEDVSIDFDTKTGKIKNTHKVIGSLNKIVDIASSFDCLLALKDDGTVWSLGGMFGGTLGVDYLMFSETPVKVQGLKDIKSIAAGAEFCFAIDKLGNLYGWGDNSNGELTSTKYHGNKYEWNEIINQIITLNIGQLYIYINGEKQQISAAPVIQEATTMIPIREVIEGLGGTVNWNGELQQVKINLENNELILTIGNKEAILNGKSVGVTMAPQIIGDKTYLPLRFACESIGAEVLWEDTSQKITIIY